MDISVTQFKAKCLGVVDKVRTERCRVRIMKYGKAAAELIPVGEEPAPPLWGRSANSTRIHGDLFTTGESWNADA